LTLTKNQLALFLAVAVFGIIQLYVLFRSHHLIPFLLPLPEHFFPATLTLYPILSDVALHSDLYDNFPWPDVINFPSPWQHANLPNEV
jgi:hypothetical protein